MINNIKNKKLKDSMNDIINNIGNKKFDDPADIDFSSSFNNLRDLVDEINKNNQTDHTDQVDFNELSELIKAKLELGNLKPVEPFKPVDLSVSRPPNIKVNVPKIQKSKSIDKDIKKHNGLSYSPDAGEKFAIYVKELEIKNARNDVKYFNDRLKDNDLSLAEFKKINDDIDQLKKSLTIKELEFYELKKDLTKRIRTDQAKSSKDQNK